MKIRGIDRHQVRIHGRRNVNLWFFSPVEIFSCFWKTMQILPKKDHLTNVCRKIMQDFGRKIVLAVVESHGNDNNAGFLTFPLKMSSECLTQDDWHTSLKLLALKWILNWTQGLIALLFPSPCLLNSQFCRNRPTSAKLKLYDAHRITPTGKVSLACE